MPSQPNPHEERHNVELRLRAAVESSPSGLLMVDRDGRIVLVNREIERLFGYPREELLGRSVDMLVPERFRAEHPAFRAGFVAAPRVRAMGAGRELHGLRKDGTEVPVEIGLTPVITSEGLFILSAVVDISARRRAEERFRLAVEAAPNGKVMVDEKGLIVLVNRETERMFGWQREELLGKPIEMLVPERFRAAHPAFRAEFQRDPRKRVMGAGRELYGLRKDGSEFPVEIGLNPIHTDQGSYVLSAIVDISERKRAEAEQRRLEGELRQSQKMESIGTLAGGIAHDFNNILGAIVGYAELAREAPDHDKAAADLTALLEVAERGREIVQRILTFSRRQESARRPLDLASSLREVAKLLRATLPTSIEIRVRDGGAMPRVMADATGVHQVLMNLANNAAQAMAGGGVLEFALEPVYLYDRFVRAHPGLREGEHVRLTVRDDGAGMPPEVLARAFEPFFTTKPPGRGTGLGLAMVHSIMKDHAGAVDLASEPGRGTTVTCYFPALAAEAAETAATVEGMPLGSGQRILFVDDEPALARVGERMLQKLGYRAIAVGGPREALAALQEDPGAFDLLVTDYSMPQGSGLELAAAARGLRPDLPIVLMTGYVEDLLPEQLAAAGIRQLLRKPVTLEQFARAAHAALQARA